MCCTLWRYSIHGFEHPIPCGAAGQRSGARLLLGQGYSEHQNDSSRKNKVSASKSIRDVVCRWQRVGKNVRLGGILLLMKLLLMV